MVLFATNRLTYVLNMFSFIRRRSTVDLLFYSGRQTRAAYVQHKLRRRGKTRGTCRVPKLPGRTDLMQYCSQLVSLSLAETGVLGPGMLLPSARLRAPHKGGFLCRRWPTHFVRAVGQVAGVCLCCLAATSRAKGPTAPPKQWVFLCKIHRRWLRGAVALITAAWGGEGG